MRAFRVGAGAVLGLVGLVVCLAGAVTAFWIVGPDDVLSLRPHSFRGNVVAVTSRPDLLDYFGSRVVVTVEPTQADSAVFVGVGHDIDVRSYLGKVHQTQVSKVAYPSSVTTTDVPGPQSHVLHPASLDWWVAKVSGTGRQTLRWQLADGPYDLVVMRTDGATGLDVKATFGLEVKGAFGSSLLVFAAGAVLLAGGVLLTGWVRRRPRVDDDGELDWEGRELWEQNEYWTSSEQPNRIGGVLVPGDVAPVPDRSADDEPAQVSSMRGGDGPSGRGGEGLVWRGGEGPSWQLNGVSTGPGGVGEPMRSGEQRLYGSDADPARPPKVGPPTPGPSHPPGSAGPMAGPSSPPQFSPPHSSPPHVSPAHVSPAHVPPHDQSGPVSAPDSRGFTAPGPVGPFRREPVPTRTGDPPAHPPWRPAGAPGGPAGPVHRPRPGQTEGPAQNAEPGHAAGPQRRRRAEPQSPRRPKPGEPDLSDFPPFEPDQAEPPPWLPGPVGQPFTLPADQQDDGDRPPS